MNCLLCPFYNKPEYLFDININNILYQIDRVKSFYVNCGRNATLNEYASRQLKVRISGLKRNLTLLGYRNEVFLPFNTDLANLAYVYDCLSQLHYYKLKKKSKLK